MNGFVEICKGKDGSSYPAFKIDLGYSVRIASFDRLLCVELSKKSPQELYSLSVGTKIPIKFV